MSLLADAIARGVQAVQEAEAILMTAGAGMGVDSGLPDFRGQTGFWQAYPAIAKLGISFAQMANPAWFDRDPRLAWAFYGHRLALYRQTKPHVGFAKLLAVAVQKPAGGFVVTSNVDGHFQQAGFDPMGIEECHGSIHYFQCSRPCGDAIWLASQPEFTIDESFRAVGPLPVCPDCGAVARPNILMFGDGSWLDWRTEQQAERLHQWFAILRRDQRRLVIIEIGAGLAVPTIRFRSESYANDPHTYLIRINPRDFQVPESARQISLPVGGAEGIALLLD